MMEHHEKYDEDDEDADEGTPSEYMFNNDACLKLLLDKSPSQTKETTDATENKPKYFMAKKLAAAAVESDDEDEDEETQEFGSFSGGGNKILEQLINGLRENKFDNLGIIAMELAAGFQTLRTFELHPNYKLFENYARHELIALAIEQQIVHCDFHTENLMINPDYEGYFDGKMGKCLLIDFGLTKKIEGILIDVLNSLSTPPIITKDVINKINIFSNKNLRYKPYAWFNEFTDADLDEINELFASRSRAKQQLVEYSQETKRSNPSTLYPNIPLKLIDYQTQLPKMAHGMFFSGGGGYNGGGLPNSFYETPNVKELMKNIFKTMSFGINSFFKLDNKYNKNNKLQIVPLYEKSKNSQLQIKPVVYKGDNIVEPLSQAIAAGGLFSRKYKRRKYKTQKKRKNKTRKNKRKTINRRKI
jgi:hypothetical protein